MSRPSKKDAKRLEALEGAAGLLGQAMESTGVLAVRLRQVLRRAPELARVIEPADRELALIVDHCDEAQQLLITVLESDQVKRTDKNKGGKE